MHNAAGGTSQPPSPETSSVQPFPQPLKATEPLVNIDAGANRVVTVLAAMATRQPARVKAFLSGENAISDTFHACGLPLRCALRVYRDLSAFGYTADPAAQQLIPNPNETPIVQTIFDMYVNDRLGSSTIANHLNQRGHTTTSGGPWSAYQVLRVLANRMYLGELTFRDITTTNCHKPLIDARLFAQAQDILAARGEDHSHRAANGSDYQLTGKMRCPQCRKAFIGTRAHGKTKTYRYYTCFTRARYDTNRCNAPRINADALEPAVLDALSTFYRNQHRLIADAITRAQAHHLAAQHTQRTELAAIEAKLTQTNQAIDRYLTAFENGTLDEDLLGERLTLLRTKTKQLRTRRDELTDQLADTPTHPEPATLAQVADHITDIITSGTPNQAKALIEALIAEIKITGPGIFIPVSRVPQPHYPEAPTHSKKAPTGKKTQVKALKEGVRAMTNSVERWGVEPSPRTAVTRTPRPTVPKSTNSRPNSRPSSVKT